MAFVGQDSGGTALDITGLFPAVIASAEVIENPYYGETTEFGTDTEQYKTEILLDIEVPKGTVGSYVEEVDGKTIWHARRLLKKSAHEKSKMRELAIAVGIWSDNPPGFDDEKFVGQPLQVHVQHGKIVSYLPPATQWNASQ